jgi:hypothetical protein
MHAVTDRCSRLDGNDLHAISQSTSAWKRQMWHIESKMLSLKDADIIQCRVIATLIRTDVGRQDDEARSRQGKHSLDV